MPPPPYAALACIGGAVLILLVVMVAKAPAMVPACLLPLVVGMCLLLSSERRFLARFTATGLEVARPQLTIPYRELLEVRPVAPLADSHPRSFAIEIVHDRGGLLIPAPLSVPSDRVYAFLRAQLPEGRRCALPAVLEQYRADQERTFGADRVWSCGGRRGPFRRSGGPLGSVAIGLTITGIAWIALAIARGSQPGWLVAGVSAIVVGAVLFIFDAARPGHAGGTRRPLPNGSALVISPLGIAVQQGTLNGHLTWEEIKDVRVHAPAAAFGTSSARPPAINLVVEGATISLTDSYDRPLEEIRDRIVLNWQ
jgi:hypothetical protein